MVRVTTVVVQSVVTSIAMIASCGGATTVLGLEPTANE